MSPALGPAFTIPGYTTMSPPGYDVECDATVHAADGVVGYPAFWLHFLSGPLGAHRESEAAFGVQAADYDAMCDVLNDPERWPAVSVRLDGEVWLRIVYRNLEDEAGLDFVEDRPGRPAKVVASVEGHGFTSAMTWAELLAAAALPDERLTWAQRLILMLPMLGPQELPEDAGNVMHRALDEIGAANRSALVEVLLDAMDWRTH
ncbi:MULTISPECIES: hypothetical protein [Micromonospora]|uniref:hypothetical protein n=1 Tax=Micromonospora TaxID=1873 RepID=UPI0021CA0DC4|nr:MULTISPECIES: hypothetical protein [unclassified Micromonospora]MCZ7427799.1 hypothetical protein [Micromonospora sp. WMMA1949]WBC06716.1 hypothetical protein O7604_15780 [Micromonospora sp. WMMA1947]